MRMQRDENVVELDQDHADKSTREQHNLAYDNEGIDESLLNNHQLKQTIKR